MGLAASGVDGPLRSWREGQLQEIFRSGASLRLQFPKEDLGFCYSHSPLTQVEKPAGAVPFELVIEGCEEVLRLAVKFIPRPFFPDDARCSGQLHRAYRLQSAKILTIYMYSCLQEAHSTPNAFQALPVVQVRQPGAHAHLPEMIHTYLQQLQV